MSSSAFAAIMVIAIGALGIFALLFTAHEAAIRTVLRQGGVRQSARVVDTRRSYGGKNTTYYIRYAYEPHNDPYNRIVQEQSVSWWLYRQAKNGQKSSIQIKYLPGKPGISRIMESIHPASMMLGVAVIGLVAAVIVGSFTSVTSSARAVPNAVWAILILVGVGWTVAYVLMTSHYTQFINPEKVKGSPRSETPTMEDDPFALVTGPEKPSGTPTKPKRGSGFTPLEDDHPLI